MKKLKYFILVFMVFPFLQKIGAQNHPAIDSLLIELKKAKKDTGRVTIFNILSEQYIWRGNYDKARIFADSALILAQKANYQRGTAAAYNQIGLANFFQGDYPQALENSLTALQMAEHIGNKDLMAGAYKNIGLVYSRQNNKTKAIENYKKAIKFMESEGNQSGIAKIYNNIGIVFADKAQYKEAIENYTKAYDLMKSIGDIRSQYVIYNNIGDMHSRMGDYSSAMEKYHTSLKVFLSLKDEKGMILSYFGIGNTLINLNRAKESKKWLFKALELSKKLDAKEYIKISYKALSKADSITGAFVSSLENYKMYIIYHDSLNNEKNTRQLTQSAMQYEFGKKHLTDSLHNLQLRTMAAENLKKQKIYTIMGLSLAVILLAFTGMAYRTNTNLAKEKHKSESLLLNILPTEVADELKEKGKADAKQFDNVSVLLTDFVNFTETSQHLSPKTVVKELNECFTAFDNIIVRNGLEKIKTIGDAYLAVCGLPTTDPDHAQKTVRAALEIIAFIEARKQQEQTFDIRVGIHSGSVIAGIVGVKKFAFDIWGETVNNTQRMEQSSDPGKINISEATYLLVHSAFHCTYRGKIEAKGKGMVDMYYVDNPKNDVAG